MAASGEGEDEFIPEAEWDTESLGESASDSIFEYRDYTRSGRGASPEAVSALARAGLLLSFARPRLSDPAAWVAFLKRHDISRLEASDAQAASAATDGKPPVAGVSRPGPEDPGRRLDGSGPSHPDDQFSVLLTITRISGVVERLVDDLPALGTTPEPTDAIRREVTRTIDLLRTLEGRIAR